jgi:hypothetical protein
MLYAIGPKAEEYIAAQVEQNQECDHDDDWRRIESEYDIRIPDFIFQ